MNWAGDNRHRIN